MADRERERSERSGDVSGYAILALLCLLLVDLAGGLLPLPEWAVMALAAVRSVPVIAGLLKSGNHFHVLLFCVVFLNLLTDFRSPPGWADVAANVAWVAILPVAILVVSSGGGEAFVGRGPTRATRTP